MVDFMREMSYEAAMGVLGQGRQPFMNAILKEREKARPSQALIRYCEMRLDAIDELQDSLDPSDMDTVDLILDPNPALKVF